MKKLFLMLLLSVFSLSGAPNTFAQEKDDKKLAAWLKSVTNRTSEGLVERRGPDGGVSVDLKGRFQHALVAKTHRSGSVIVGCVNTLKEANHFYGRDLETGKPVPMKDIPEDSISALAGKHGMTAAEFEYFRDMIAEAERRRLLNPDAATITIVNNDGAGEGFNDPTAATPEGGNTGTTLGQQRLNLFDFAAGIWGAFLNSSVNIEVRSQFDDLTCSTNSGTLGSAGTTTVHRDFSGAGFPGTWHHQPLANKQSGSDRSTGNPDINATFNSRVNNDPNCLGGNRFYLGFDNTTPAGTINLLVVLLHEMAHGLGFSDFSDASTGVLFNGFPDVFTTHMFDQSTNEYWNDMTNAERMASAINTNNVFWDGGSVRGGSGALTAGRDPSNGRVQVFTPNPVQSGSSISHWDSSAFPNLLMEPVINLGLPIDLDQTRDQMRDIGWFFGDIDLDFEGDGRVDIGIFRPSVGQWWIQNSSDLGTNVDTFGIGTDTITPADFTGDGKTDIGFFRPSSGEWFVLRSEDSSFFSFPFGTTGDIPAPGDYDGDGQADPAVFRPSDATWYILNSGGGTTIQQFGLTGDNPIPQDYDGDGKDDIAIFRPSVAEWFYQRSSDNGVIGFQFGANGDTAVPNDYTGDGKADIGFFRPSSGEWFILRSEDNSFFAFPFGVGTDIPVPGDYDGDGIADAAVFRPSNNTWFLQQTTDGFEAIGFGVNNDIPVPSAYVP